VQERSGLFHQLAASFSTDFYQEQVSILSSTGGLDFSVIWIVAGEDPVLFLNRRIKRFEDSWSKSLSCGHFLNMPTKCSMKYL
jgi:hypothetical protein